MGLFSSWFSKAITCDLTITSGNGFHLRPIAKFVSVAKTFSSDIEASFNHRTANAKAVNALLSLSLEQGDIFSLRCKGKDAQEASEALETLFKTLMKDDVEVISIQKVILRIIEVII